MVAALGACLLLTGCSPLQTADAMRRDFMAQTLVKQAAARAAAGQADGRAVQLAAWATRLAPENLPVLRLATTVFVRGQAWDRALEGLLAQQRKTGVADAYQLGACYVYLGQEERGAALLDALVGQERSRFATHQISGEALAVVLNEVGYTYADAGVRLEEAVELTRAAVSLAPGNAFILDSLGWAYYRVGRDDAAAFALEQALRLQRRPDAVIYYHAGVVHSRQGKVLLARAELRRALSLQGDDFPEAAEALRRMHWQLPPPETV